MHRPNGVGMGTVYITHFVIYTDLIRFMCTVEYASSSMPSMTGSRDCCNELALRSSQRQPVFLEVNDVSRAGKSLGCFYRHCNGVTVFTSQACLSGSQPCTRAVRLRSSAKRDRQAERTSCVTGTHVHVSPVLTMEPFCNGEPFWVSLKSMLFYYNSNFA